MSASADQSAPSVGALHIIGGAEDKLKRRTVLRHFVEACGGTDATIAVIPTASSLGPEVVDIYAALFERLGAARVVGIRPESRERGQRPRARRRSSTTSPASS